MASNVQSKLLLEAAQQYAQAISPEALAVLEGRGISEETAGLFQLGLLLIQSMVTRCMKGGYLSHTSPHLVVVLALSLED